MTVHIYQPHTLIHSSACRLGSHKPVLCVFSVTLNPLKRWGLNEAHLIGASICKQKRFTSQLFSLWLTRSQPSPVPGKGQTDSELIMRVHLASPKISAGLFCQQTVRVFSSTVLSKPYCVCESSGDLVKVHILTRWVWVGA